MLNVDMFLCIGTW